MNLVLGWQVQVTFFLCLGSWPGSVIPVWCCGGFRFLTNIFFSSVQSCHVSRLLCFPAGGGFCCCWRWWCSLTLFGKYRRFCLFCLLSADTIVQIHPESNAAVVMITHITSPALGDSGVFMVPWLRALEQAHVMARSIQIRAEVPIYLYSILKNSSWVGMT